MTIDKNKIRTRIGWIKQYYRIFTLSGPENVEEKQFLIIDYEGYGTVVDLEGDVESLTATPSGDEAWMYFTEKYLNDEDEYDYKVIDYGIYE